jgi:hypothetical protein
MNHGSSVLFDGQLTLQLAPDKIANELEPKAVRCIDIDILRDTDAVVTNDHMDGAVGILFHGYEKSTLGPAVIGIFEGIREELVQDKCAWDGLGNRESQIRDVYRGGDPDALGIQVREV